MFLQSLALLAAALPFGAAAPSGLVTSDFTQLYPSVRHEVRNVPLTPAQVHTRRDVPVLGRNEAELPDGSVAHILPFHKPGAPVAPAVTDNFSALLYHGGAIQKAPKQVLVLWGFGRCTTYCTNDPDNTVPILYNFLKGVGGSHYLNSTTQYTSAAQGHITNPRNTMISFLVDNNTAPAHPTQAQVVQQVKLAQTFLKLKNNKDINYVVALGFRHDPPGFGPGGFCAFHSDFGTRTSFQPFTDEPYVTEAGDGCSANTVNGPRDGVSVVLGHEVGEAITDPGNPSSPAWFDASGGENGDKCANLGFNRNVQLFTGVFPVQPLFSNAGRYCAF